MTPLAIHSEVAAAAVATNSATAKKTINSATGSSTRIDFLVVVSGNGSGGATPEAPH
jgi:hypothetical protein